MLCYLAVIIAKDFVINATREKVLRSHELIMELAKCSVVIHTTRASITALSLVIAQSILASRAQNHATSFATTPDVQRHVENLAHPVLRLAMLVVSIPVSVPCHARYRAISFHVRNAVGIRSVVAIDARRCVENSAPARNTVSNVALQISSRKSSTTLSLPSTAT